MLCVCIDPVIFSFTLRGPYYIFLSSTIEDRRVKLWMWWIWSPWCSYTVPCVVVVCVVSPQWNTLLNLFLHGYSYMCQRVWDHADGNTYMRLADPHLHIHLSVTRNYQIQRLNNLEQCAVSCKNLLTITPFSVVNKPHIYFPLLQI